MSTRANVIIESKKWNNKLYFYRHSDGYPEGVKPSLDKFVELLQLNTIRDNIIQSAGHLILIGMVEYNMVPKFSVENDLVETYQPKGWKCGAYEPTTGLHGDIEHLYIIDLDNKTWKEVPNEDWESY